MSTATLHHKPRRARRKRSSSSGTFPVAAPPLAGGDFEAMGDEITAYLETPEGLDLTSAQREALWHLASAPFEVTSVRELCVVIARVLRALDLLDVDELVAHAFERKVQRGVRS